MVRLMTVLQIGKAGIETQIITGVSTKISMQNRNRYFYFDDYLDFDFHFDDSTE